MHVNKSQEKSDVRSNNNGVKVTRVFEGHTTNNRSFAHVLKGNKELETESNPAIMLDDDCIMKKDLSFSLIGRVKDFASLANIKSVFNNEGFTDNTFNKIAMKCGDLLDIDDQEDTSYHSKRLCIFTKMRSNVLKTFKVIFRRKVFWIRAKEVPGWVPEFMEESDDESIFEEEMPDMEGENTMVSDDSISREHPPGFTPKKDDKELDHVDDNISEPKEDLQEDKDVNSTCMAVLQYMVQMVTIVTVGHIDQLSLASVAIATSLTNVTGFSLLMVLGSGEYVVLGGGGGFE
nr:hydroxycinnamoyl-CoA quinate/shikimate transferase [Tanacetum cinerariifolium]